MKRRLLYVIGSLNVGGAERHLAQVAINLKRRGWEPEVFALAPVGPLVADLTEAGIPVYGFRLPKWIDAAISNERAKARAALLATAVVLLATLWRRRPRVVHFFLPAAYIIGGLVSLLSLVPARIMSRRSLASYQRAHPRLSKVERRLHKRMTAVCGNSLAVVNELRDEGVDPSQLRLIYNGIDVATYEKPFNKLDARGALGISSHAMLFIIVANLIPYKGHADLISALSKIKLQLPKDWVLLCVGRDDGVGEQLQAQINAEGLQKNIRMLGARADVPSLLRMSDIGVLCSHEEGFSNAVLEGMASGLPMVVTDVGGNAEAIVDGECGYVVPSKNPAALADALLKAATDPDRKIKGGVGKQRALDLFALTACVKNYETLYYDVGVK